LQKKELAIGGTIGGIIVAIMFSFVLLSSLPVTETKNEPIDLIQEASETVRDYTALRGNPRNIVEFDVIHDDDMIFLSLKAAGTIPTDAKRLTLEQGVLGIGYLWAGQNIFEEDHEFQGPGHLAGYLTSIKQGTKEYRDEIWQAEFVKISMKNQDEFCIDSSQTSGKVNVRKDVISLAMPRADLPSGFINQAITFDLVSNETCHMGLGGKILDIKYK